MLAAAMLLHPGLDLDRDNVRCVAGGANDCIVSVTWLLVANVVCMALAAVLAFHAINLLTGRVWLAWIGLLWVFASASYGFFGRQFFSEALAGLLILLLSLALWRLLASGASRRACLAAGLLLGVLTLTKASFYYFLPPLAVGLGLVLWKALGLGGREAALRTACVAAGVLVLTVPWQIRNGISVGTFSLTGRAGLVLAQRANINDITEDRFLELFAYYSPSGSMPDRYLRQYKTPEFREWYGGPDGPMAQPYRRQAELQKSFVERRSGLKRARGEQMVGREALGRILADPMAHFRAIPLIAYRGIMSERGFGFIGPKGTGDYGPAVGRTLGEHLGVANLGKLHVGSVFSSSLALFLPAFVAFPWCLATRRWALVFLMAPAAFLFAFYSMASPYVDRFSAPLFPTLIVIALLSVSAMLDKAVAGYRVMSTSRQAS